MTTTFGASAPAAAPDTRWRTRDIVVTAVIGVAFGVVFWVWNLAWAGPVDLVFAFAPPLKDLGYAVWLIPAVLAPLVVRYRLWTFPVLAVAAIGSATAAWIHDWVVWYPTVAVEVQLLRGILMAISAVIIVAGGSVALHHALKQAGALEGFPD